MKKIIYTIAMAFCVMASFASCKEKDMSMKMNEPRISKGSSVTNVASAI